MTEGRKLALLIIGIICFFLCLCSLIMEKNGVFDTQSTHTHKNYKIINQDIDTII